MSDGTFDPASYLTKVSGQDYLEVKWRLVWLRHEHPNAIITTELLTHDGQMAIFKATVEIPTEPGGEGGGIGTGHGSEQYGDFRDYIEKAETKAIGRALGSLGFGTQFSKEWEFGADQNRIVDAPVDLQRQRDGRRTQPAPRTQQASPDASQRAQTYERAKSSPVTEQAMTSRQKGFIDALTHELGISDDALKLECESSFGTTAAELSRRDASVLIERLQQRRNERPASQPNLVDNGDAAARARS